MKVDFVDNWDPEVDTIHSQGGVYVSRDGEEKHLVPINIYRPEEYTGDPDAYIIFCKQMGLQKMLEQCAHFFKPHQYAISCMNGMGHIEKINQYFPKEHVLGGTALIATVLNGAGDVDFIGRPNTGTMNICPQTEVADDFTHQVVADFQAAHLNPNLTDNFVGTLMAKVTFNSVVNTLCTMFEITMGDFIAWESVVHVSRDANPLHYPSMYQDMSKNRPTEVDYINGYIYEVGHAHGFEASTHNFLRNLVHLAEFGKTFDMDAFRAEVLAR